MPSFTDAIPVPSTRDLIFVESDVARATSGEPCFGLTSTLNREKPQSSVEPRRSFAVYFAAPPDG